MKKTFLVAIAVFSFSVLNAQSEGSNWLKAGVHFGVPVGDASKFSSFVLGADLKYQFLGLDSFALGAATGYTNYFSKKAKGSNVKVDDFGIVPLALLMRYYATKNFFIGADLGYGFNTSKNKNAKGGFYYRPEVGYHNDSWNIFAFYQGVSLKGFSPTAIGVGVNYNILQGVR